ncbi:MAG: hypothetical protein HW419_3613 [Deltaproteobacteria bacterium]|nr:hypothetical protein [Deltaproteobacteria bacterium]
MIKIPKFMLPSALLTAGIVRAALTLARLREREEVRVEPHAKRAKRIMLP